MPIVNITNFGNGHAEDYSYGGLGECSVCKNFDILTYPNRLQPLRGMATESTTNSVIGNIIVSPTTGKMYGVGKDPNNPTLGKLWYRNDYGGSGTWQSLTNNQLSGAVLRDDDYAFLVENPNELNARKMYWASTNLLVASDPNGASSATTQALTFTTISQGFVFPTSKILYFAYQTATKTYIGRITPNATPFGAVNFTALELPVQYRIYSLSSFGNYLAIACTTPITAGGINSSVVLLWDRDETLTTVSEIIPWGAGRLKVLNNLNGVLVGLSQLASNNVSGYAINDQDKISLKIYSGGSIPQDLKDINALRVTATAPSCSINPNVNFIYNNRMYFSIDVVNGDSNANYYGLWSLGLNKNGRYSVSIEKSATNDNSETSVLAGAIAGDMFCFAHTTNGTLTFTYNSVTAGYVGTSYFESTINPEMPEDDRRRKKQLQAVYVTTLPLPADGQVVLKYRVDSNKDDAWTTIFTETTDDKVLTEAVFNSSKVQFTSGVNYEFRIESTGGAIITGFGYKYDNINTQI